jgi:hypothetical protein
MQPSHPFAFPELRWQENAAAMDALCQIDQSPSGPAAALEDECVLSGEGPLGAVVVVRDNCCGRQTQCPLDLGTTVMVATVV